MILRELRMYPTMLRVGLATMVAYRVEVVIWILTTTMPLIMYSVWSTIAEETPLGRFDEATFASYFLVTLVARQLSGSWLVWELNDQIRSGHLSAWLLKPVHPYWMFSADNLSALPLRVAVLTPIVAIAFVLLPEMSISKDPAHWALFTWTLAVSWALTFFVQSVIGLLALYTQQSLAFQDAWFGLWIVMSGYLIPLELTPGLRSAAIWLPFWSMGSLPTEIILGHLDSGQILRSLVVQLTWLLAILALSFFTWRRALSRFEAYGG